MAQLDRNRAVGCRHPAKKATYSSEVLALTVDMAKNVALGILAGVLVLGFLAIKITKSVTQKAISLLLTAGVVLGVWTQRANLSSCADKVKAQTEAGGLPDTTCTFFGTDVKLALPDSLRLP